MDTEENALKKYIRTFAGDVAIVKEGGTPNLVQLAESKTSPASPPEPARPSPIETYAGDFSDRMEETNASTATVLAAEQDAAPQKQSAPDVSRSGSIYIFAGIMLLVASGFGAYFAYVRYSASLEPIMLAPAVSSPIFVDEREQVSGVGTALLQAIEQSINRPLASGAVRFLYAENATGSTSSPQANTDNGIFSALQTPAPDILLRNLNAAGSMAGVVSAGGNQSPFFILSVVSYGETFSGMLSWEPTMPRDLALLFPPYAVASTTATVSTSSPQAIIAAGFRDEVVGNHDARVYRDAARRSILLYGYWNRSTLVIARDPAAFAEILRRLATSRAQQ